MPAAMLRRRSLCSALALSATMDTAFAPLARSAARSLGRANGRRGLEAFDVGHLAIHQDQVVVCRRGLCHRRCQVTRRRLELQVR